MQNTHKVNIHVHKHKCKQHIGSQQFSTWGKNTEIKSCVIMAFDLKCWQSSKSPVVTLDNFMTLVSADWDKDQD